MLEGKRVCVVMPAYNAERTLEQTVAEVPRPLVDDIVVVDDRSSDATVDVARRLAPDIGDVFVNRGAALVLMGRYDEAEADLTRGISLGSKRPQDALFNRAVAREARGDLKGAYLDYSQAARLAPDWQAPKTELARFAVSRPGQ
jgi:glycosyltransferase involved in cell wall biosynthesis